MNFEEGLYQTGEGFLLEFDLAVSWGAPHKSLTPPLDDPPDSPVTPPIGGVSAASSLALKSTDPTEGQPDPERNLTPKACLNPRINFKETHHTEIEKGCNCQRWAAPDMLRQSQTPNPYWVIGTIIYLYVARSSIFRTSQHLYLTCYLGTTYAKVKFEEELSPVCIRLGRVSSSNLILQSPGALPTNL